MGEIDPMMSEWDPISLAIARRIIGLSRGYLFIFLYSLIIVSCAYIYLFLQWFETCTVGSQLTFSIILEEINHYGVVDTYRVIVFILIDYYR